MNKAIHKLIFLLPLAATLLSACSQDDAPVTLNSQPEPPQITVTRSTASGDSELKTIFQNGTEVGLSVQGSSAYTNMKYEYRNGALQAVGKNIIWDKGVSSLTVDAYYPYRSNGNYTNPSVYEDQSTTDNYYQSDALHATGTVSKSSNSMSLDFKHRTAKMIFTFAEDVDEVNILNQALTPGETANKTIKAYRETARKWKACIIPQTNLTVNVKKSTKVYQAELEETFNAEQQYSYELELYIPAKIGDFYYQDGTFSPTYTNNNSNPCIGIVCAVKGDEIMRHLNKSGYTRGLVVALYDAPKSGSGWFPNIGNYADSHPAPVSGTSGWYAGNKAELAWLFSGIYYSSFSGWQNCGNELQKILDPIIAQASGDKLVDKEYVFGEVDRYFHTIKNGTLITQYSNTNQFNRAFLAY